MCLCREGEITEKEQGDYVHKDIIMKIIRKKIMKIAYRDTAYMFMSLPPPTSPSFSPVVLILT